MRVRVVAPASLATATAVVELRAPGSPGPLGSAHVIGAAIATFRRLPPATYEIRVDVPGGAPAQASFRVDAAETVTVDAVVLAGASGSHIDLVDRDREGQGISFREQQLRDLPGGTNLWALLETAEPFLISDRIDNGGLSTARSALVGSRGASWTSTSLAFGEISLPNPDSTGTLPIVPDLNAAEAVVVTAGLAPVEIATAGAAIAIAPRRPPTGPQGALEADVTSGRMVGRNARPDAPSIGRLNSWKDAGLQLGGPVHDRVGMFLSAALTRSEQDARNSPVPSATVGSLFTHLVVRPSLRDEVQVVAAIQGLAHAYDGRDQFRDTNVSERDTFSQWQGSWDTFSDRGAHGLVSLSYARGAFTPQLVRPVGGALDRVTDGMVPPPASAVATGRWAGHVAFDPRAVHRGGMDHTLRMGATFDQVSASSSVLALPPVAELVNGLPARVWVNMAPASDSQRHVTALSGYLADRMTASDLVLEAGLRLDRSAASATGAAAGITWLTLGPRVSFRWTPAYVTVFGGYSRYHPRLSPDLLAYGDPGAPWAQVYRWNDANGNHQFDPGELGVLVARAGTGQAVASIDPMLRAPSTDELAVGVEEQLGSLMTFRAGIVARWEHTLVGSVNVGVPATSYSVFYVQDQGEDYSSPTDDRLLAIYNRLPSSFGQDRFVLTNPAGDNATYQGFEMHWELTAHRLYMLIGAMAYRTKGMGGNRGFGVFENDQGIVGERFENPNAASYSTGALFFDRSYVGKVSMSYDAPGDVHVGVSARYQDGQPFSRLVIAPDLAQGPEIVQAYRTGRTRFTFTFTLDMRIEKGLTIAGHRAAVTLDIFNLTNLANEVEENAVTGLTFRQATAVQPPRTVRLGFRVAF
jgi:hypothetical protein